MKFDPWSSQDCISSFCHLYFEDFQEWAWEKSIHKDLWPDKEIEFCEYRKSAFLDFSERYLESLIEEEADRINDQKKSEE